MANMPIQTRLNQIFGGIFSRQQVSPTQEAGTSGTAISGGFVVSRERDSTLRGRSRYETAQDILLNAAVVGAGMRFFMNLVSRPKWTFMPPGGIDATSEARVVADRMQAISEDMTDSWERGVRRMAAHRFHGFNIHEWTAKILDDGSFGYESLEVRPWNTIERWDTDAAGKIYGLTQRPPLGGQELYLPRGKLVYLVDDAFSDSPEGIGLWRHLAEPFQRLKTYEKLEGMGYQRDLRGIPVGSAPYRELMEAVNDQKITQQQMDALTKPIEKFVQQLQKGNDTGLVIDSSVYMSESDTGETASPNKMFGMELMSSSSQGFADLANAIDRVQYQMAMLCGSENLLVGSGNMGSKALSEDKSRNLYLNVDGCQADIVSAVNRDFIPPIMKLNRVPRELWPTAVAEKSAFIDAVQKSQVLVNLANAGAMTTIEDPAVNQIRLEAGLKEVAADMLTLDAMNDTGD